MKAEERSVSSVLSEEVTYVIPSFQRPYSWGKDNVNQLLDDLWEAYEGGDREYFLGSLITIQRDKKKLFEVIDGQQRLTTLNLVFAKLRDLVEEGAAKAELGKRIRPQNPLTNESETPRLIVRRKDRDFFVRHVLDAIPVPSAGRDLLSAPQKRITENLEEIDGFLRARTNQQLKGFANYLLHSVFIVFVQTESMDSAYRLFNTLNARGMSLSNADLIKNSLFKQTDADDEMGRRLEESWTALEEEIGIERLDAFFGHHRTAVTGVKASKKLHEEMDEIIAGTAGGALVFLDEVQKSADNYVRILASDFKDAYTNRSMRALRRIGYDEWIPPLLAYMNDPLEDVSEPEFVGLLEKITMQNWVRRLGRTARLTVYYQLINAIGSRIPGDDIRLIFMNAARNEEFMQLLGSEVYGAPFAHAVLLRLEESAQDISVTKSFNGSLTIEHVLPKAMREEYWTSRFQPDQHVRWLNRLGNLAMLSGSKNSRAQYYDFDRKKGIYNHANQQVSFDLTKEVCDEPEWNLGAIEKRHKRLLDLASITWTI